ncbi:MAG: hypothetical protein HUJ31_17055, partial [Pseudomonadales bacterium]|nr:hypothetical protein [Pseudomonadales bacterium]
MRTTIALFSLLVMSGVARGQDPLQDMVELSANLNTCSSFSQKFTHPFTGEVLTRTIKGYVDGKCVYVEQMPNGGKLECHYPEDARVAVASYYRQLGTFGGYFSTNSRGSTS